MPHHLARSAQDPGLPVGVEQGRVAHPVEHGRAQERLIGIYLPRTEVQDGGRYEVEWSGQNDQGSPVSSGVYVGTVEAYTVIDALAGYRLPFARRVTVTVSALNLLDNDHIEFVGAPPIGLLVMGSVRAEF